MIEKPSDDQYLYKSFRLGRVNKAEDYQRPANPYLSFAVLAGGLIIAGALFMMHKAVTVADNLTLSASVETIQQ
ncbi:MAG: hypothetical protein COV34_02400 [Candidatus Zambryskibacteria bacterium CG10_big_fil_rev_8_21_14_0_10_42_12]|uniref:Uncharacterized protein n=1 Tax=Candidatus Zambryskibacteria bacterium CG10_big_fil_rev_8_21_14_0_10_42_12 TaxID=1975115 RepID=A0A2H0QVE2_9BACT|nr:MAG: hypothetical protein COV34_02400 [Candidatus Zambryskibacteria bacterium CG10_big_fil_rev_8_21_14_0_10_42_12]